jgi:argininosuccinate lyase
LIKPPLFRAHDRMMAMLPLAARLLERLELDDARLRKLARDPDLLATEKALKRAAEGEAFRDVYRAESKVLKRRREE